MNESQKQTSSKLQLNSSFWQDLSNTQQENIKGGVFDAFTKVVVQTEPSLSRIDKSSPLIAKALCSNES
jgi:type VI protein secretion system component Hcp